MVDNNIDLPPPPPPNMPLDLIPPVQPPIVTPVVLLDPMFLAGVIRNASPVDSNWYAAFPLEPFLQFLNYVSQIGFI